MIRLKTLNKFLVQYGKIYITKPLNPKLDFLMKTKKRVQLPKAFKILWVQTHMKKFKFLHFLMTALLVKTKNN